MIVGCFFDEFGNPIWARSRGTRNSVEFESKKIAWKGSPITACCSHGTGVVCITRDTEIHFVTTSQHVRFALGKREHEFHALTSIDNNLIIAGGEAGRLLSIDVAKQSILEWKLSECGVKRPARPILDIKMVSSGLAICGGRDLLCIVSLDKHVVRESSNREFLFHRMLEVDGELLFATSRGDPYGCLCHWHPERDELVQISVPCTAYNRYFVMTQAEEKVIVIGDKVCIGNLETGWHETQIETDGKAICAHFRAEDRVLKIANYLGKVQSSPLSSIK